MTKTFKDQLDADMADFARNLPRRELPSGIPKPPVIESHLRTFAQGKLVQTPNKEYRLVGTTKSNAISNAIGPR